MADSLQLSYTALRNMQGIGTLRPWLSLTLSYKSKLLETVGLVDTGADVNVLPYSVGVELGAIWEEQKVPLTLSGNLARYEARGILVSALVGQLKPVQLAFAWTRKDDVPLLLGQMNFFAEFDICFYGSRNSFEIRPKRKPGA